MELSFLHSVIIILILVVAIGVPLLMYLNGNFTYTDRIHSERHYEKTTTNNFTGGRSVDHIKRVVIERRWDSGKIEYITKEFKV
jgi:hypothetical protein